MQKVTCEHCKQSVFVNLYFYGAQITTHDRAFEIGEKHYYTAMVNSKAICPLCGQTINQIFSKEISAKSIIELAGGEVD